MAVWKKDLGKSTEQLIIDEWGEEIGTKIIQCFNDCMQANKNKSQVEQCLSKCLEEEIAKQDIKPEEITKMMDLMSNYETIGK
ncbi:MAG: hypothetical protein ACFFE5_10185 [Candidatus Thorarchaeota archaeon]